MAVGARKICKLYGLSGFSLIELTVAMAAGLTIVGAALQSVVYFERHFGRQHSQVIQQQDVRLGLELFAQELRLAHSGSLSIIREDVVEFLANVSGLTTNVAVPAAAGQLTITVNDGRGWPEGKLVSICWNDQCDLATLARAGQRNLLTLVDPAPRAIPLGASVAVMNRVRYYSRPDERGVLRWLRQVDGGASVVTGNIAGFALRYWDAHGRPAVLTSSVRRIDVEITLSGGAPPETRDISLRT